MSTLRWHPFLREWVGVAAARQHRPQMPRDWCPFCPGTGSVPDTYDTLLYPNDFAAFNHESGVFSPVTGPYVETPAQGSCDVVIYHPGHTTLPSSMSVEQWRKVVDLWTARTIELERDPAVAQVFIFENCGEAIGVTMPHPHGQIYAMPIVSPLIQREYDSAREAYEKDGACLYCHVLREELSAAARVVAENDHFVAFVPFWQRFPSEVQIYARRHVESLAGLDDAEKHSLAAMVKLIRVKYDQLYGFPMPLMMVVRQKAAHTDQPYFHFHIEFLPLQRSATKLKYLAGVESGSGTYLNDTLAEDRAEELRRA